MKKAVQEHTPNYISRRMRIMGKFMQVLHRTSSGHERISALTEDLNAANFMVLLAAVRELCGYDETSHSFNKGSLALMKHCSYLYRSCVLLFASCTDHMSFFQSSIKIKF